MLCMSKLSNIWFSLGLLIGKETPLPHIWNELIHSQNSNSQLNKDEWKDIHDARL